MKRNYLGKAMVAVAMLLTGISFTSCDENDNAIIINGKEWVKPDAIKTDDGAIITGNTASDISRILMKVAKDINDAVQAGEDYVITIDAPALESEEGDNIISIPLYDYLTADPTSTAKVVINFANPISTDVPLVLQAKGATGGSTYPAQNKVDINLPSGTSDIDLELYMPASTVTLTGGNIDELITTTAWQTLNIESGVTVNWLNLNGGYVAVKEGAKVLGFASDYIEVSNKGIRSDVYKDKVPTSWPAQEDDYYYIQKGKITKASEYNYPRIRIYGSAEGEAKEETEIIIPDGLWAWVETNTNKIMPIVNITGEGDASIMTPGSISGEIVNPWYTNSNLYGINKLNNVTVDMINVMLWNDETHLYDTPTPMDESYYNRISLPINSENCTFKAKNVNFYGNHCNDNVVSSTHKGCTFNILKDDSFQVGFPEQTDKRKTFKLAFDTCEFDQVTFDSWFYGDDEDYKDFKAYLSFDGSKIGGKAITKTTEMIDDVTNAYYWDSEKQEYVYTTSTFYTIDGANYKPVWDEGKWTLMPVE